VWKRLEHRNIVPLLGITFAPLQFISEWMPGRVLIEHVREHPDADRRSLVGVPLAVFDRMLTPTTSCLVSLAAFTTSTLVT